MNILFVTLYIKKRKLYIKIFKHIFNNFEMKQQYHVNLLLIGILDEVPVKTCDSGSGHPLPCAGTSRGIRSHARFAERGGHPLKSAFCRGTSACRLAKTSEGLIH
jgi:hypothetical protein